MRNLKSRNPRGAALDLLVAVLAGGVWQATAGTLTVTNLSDAGPGTLREAIERANTEPDAQTITIPLSGSITLAAPLPALLAQTAITGPGASRLVIDGNKQRVFEIAPNAVITLADLTIANGHAGAGGGGAILNGGNCTLLRCLVFNNSGTNFGGAIHNSGPLAADGCVFLGNGVTGEPGELTAVGTNLVAGNGVLAKGGALFSDASIVRFTNCTFSANQAVGGSGGDCPVANGPGGNGAVGLGGAIYLEEGTLLMVNCTVTSNRVAGGLGGRGGPPLGEDGNIARNSSAGGLMTSNATIRLLNTLIAGNAADTVFKDGIFAFESLGGNFLQETNGITGFTNTDRVSLAPELGPLQDNGGPLPTHALLTNSPAIDAGQAPGAPPFDARGVIRPQGAGVDVGAYELGRQSIRFTAIPAHVYGDPPFELQAVSSSQLPVDFAILSGPATLSPTNNRQVSLTGVGEVTVVATQAGAPPLYLPAPDVTNTFVIVPVPLVATADAGNRPYGEPNPPFTGTLTGVVYNDRITALFESAATPATPAGTYPAGSTNAIVPVLLDPDGKLTNYLVTLNPAALTITKADAFLVVAADDAARAYGETNPVFTGTISGLLNNDNITASYTSLATVATPAGVYGPASSNAIKPVLADPEGRLANYTVITNHGTLTITRTPVTITVANATRRVLMPDPPFTGTFSGLLPWDSAIAESVPYASSATFTSPPGDYPIYPAWPSPPAGLENYTLTTNLGTLSITGAVPTITILAPTNGSIFYAGMEVPLVAEVQPTGGVQQVDFLVGTNQFGATTTNGGIYEGTFTNIPAGSYSLTGRVVSLFGLTNYSDPVNFTVLQDVGCTLEPVDLTSLEVRQTGLYMQDVRIPNLAPIPIRSLRVAVSGLPASVSVWNATYVSNGVYYLQYDFPTAPGATNSMRLELYSRDGRDPGLTLTNIQVRVSRPLPPLDLTNGVPERLDRIVYNFTLGTVLLQFFTTNRATYYVEYAAGVPSEGGGTNWILSRPAITGNGNWQNWLDDGPPKTQSRPDADPAGQRFYRLLRVP